MIKKKENLNDENKNQIANNNSQHSQKFKSKIKTKTQIKSNYHKEGIYKLISIIKNLLHKTKMRNFKILKSRNEELKKYILQYKVISKMFRLYKHKQKFTTKLILKDWITQRNRKQKKTKQFFYVIIDIMENRISMKKEVFDRIKMNTKLTKKEYTSKIMFLLSKKFKKNIDKSFFTDQIRFFILKNRISDNKIIDLVKKNDINIKNSEYSSDKTIEDLKKSIQLYLCIELFMPMDLIFIKTKHIYYRVFLKNLFVSVHNKKRRKKIDLFKKTINDVNRKFFFLKQIGFKAINKYRPTNYKILIIFLQFFFNKKRKQIYYEFFSRLKNSKERKNSFLWVLCNKFHTWKKYNFLFLKLKALNSQKIGGNKIITSIEEDIGKKDFFKDKDEQEFRYNLNFFCKRLTRLRKNKKKVMKNKYDKLVKNLYQKRKEEKKSKLINPKKFCVALDNFFIKRKKEYFEEMYYFQGYLEIIEVEDKTHELEPRTVQHTYLNENENSQMYYPQQQRDRTLNNSQIQDINMNNSNINNRSRFDTFNKNMIRRSSYFNPQEQLYRSQALIKNLQNITTIGDIKGPTFDNFDNKQNVYKSQVFGSRTSLNPLFRRISDEGEGMMITEIQKKNSDTPIFTRDKQNNLSFKSLEEKQSPISSFLQSKIFK